MSKVIVGDYSGDTVEYIEKEKCYCITIDHSMHERLNNDRVELAYQCGHKKNDGSQAVFVIFKFGGSSCVINFTKEDYDIISKNIDIKNCD